MRCISTAYADMRCPSARVSVMFVSCVKTNKNIFEIFSPSGSPAILVFRHQTRWRYSDGNPPNGGVECRWGRHCTLGRHRDSEPISGFTACCQRCDRLGVINTAPPDRGKLWHWSLVVSGRVCWWRETTTKCLWQEVLTLRQRQQKASNCTQW